MPYEKFGMKMDFLYRPYDYNSSNESQSVTQSCSYYPLVRYTRGGNYFENIGGLQVELFRGTGIQTTHVGKRDPYI